MICSVAGNFVKFRSSKFWELDHWLSNTGITIRSTVSDPGSGSSSGSAVIRALAVVVYAVCVCVCGCLWVCVRACAQLLCLQEVCH